MPAFQFTFGSVGDIVASIQLVINIVVFLRQHGRPSTECAETEKEVKSLGSDLNLAYFTLQRTPASSLSFFVEQRLQNEFRRCHSVMAQFYVKTTDSNSFWQKIWWAVSQEKQLGIFRAQVIERRTALGVVLNFINSGALLALQDRVEEVVGSRSQQLASRDAQLPNIWDCVEHGVGALSQQLAIYQGQIMAAIGDIPHGVSTDMFFVISPTGIPIPISFAFCTSYRALHKILKVYMCTRTEAGGRYVERGDYSIVSPEGDFIGPENFVQTLTIGMSLEISIIKHHFGGVKTGCPQCGGTDAGAPHDSFAQWITWRVNPITPSGIRGSYFHLSITSVNCNSKYRRQYSWKWFWLPGSNFVDKSRLRRYPAFV
ncbi:hypothetical protein DFH07DRAFT_937242 [Mycena maculata]|uniref:Ubiquitin-like domain-containing protein n=1 Tax=Mycena maculata TaxID=230809 RepID=A0AAD7NSS3_9AGAR|nr:hypothetical protein DFH07DRAFT_937242 [Mycena maculata]